MGLHDNVAPHFRIGETTIENIGRDCPNEERKKMAVLWKWKRNNGSDATYLALANAFLEMEDRVTTETVLKYVINNCHFKPTLQKSQSVVLPERVLAKYANWDSLPPKEQESIKRGLIVEHSSVVEAFSGIFLDISMSFAVRNANPEFIKMLINIHVKPPPNVDDASVSQLFTIISKHSSWFNFRLLQIVVRKLGNEEEKGQLKQYSDKVLMPFLDRSVFEIPSKSLASCSADFHCVHFHLKLPDDIDIKGNEAMLVTNQFSAWLGVENLELSKWSEGCVKLIFAIPKAVFDSFPSDTLPYQYIEWDDVSNAYNVTTSIATIM